MVSEDLDGSYVNLASNSHCLTSKLFISGVGILSGHRVGSREVDTSSGFGDVQATSDVPCPASTARGLDLANT